MEPSGEGTVIVKDKVLLGRLGEELACGLLYAQGYQILERRFRCPMGEIDLICERDGALLFVEVKTRSDVRFGLPKEAVDRRKQGRMRRCAAYYMKTKGGAGKAASFQVVGILVEQIPGAF